MAEATGIVGVSLYKHLPDPSDAPEPFMIAMADENENGLHFYFCRECLVKFAEDLLALAYDT